MMNKERKWPDLKGRGSNTYSSKFIRNRPEALPVVPYTGGKPETGQAQTGTSKSWS